MELVRRRDRYPEGFSVASIQQCRGTQSLFRTLLLVQKRIVTHPENP
jgi:hypothetical protein